MIVRRATPDEVVPLRMQVLRPGMPESSARWTGDDEPETVHFVAVRDDRIVGTATILVRPCPEGGPQRQLRGMAVSPELQGSGVGAAILAAAIADIPEPMWCNARSTAVRFYAKLGWRVTSAEFDIPSAGPHVRMVFDGGIVRSPEDS
jgi:GNAT superfamily N-acetyltransferase